MGIKKHSPEISLRSSGEETISIGESCGKTVKKKERDAERAC